MRMMKKVGVLFFLIVICQLCLASQSDKKTYENDDFKISFSYPKSWVLDDAFSSKSKLISLYSPDALKTSQTSLDLTQGIKVEIYFDPLAEEENPEIKEKVCAQIKKGDKKIKQKCSVVDGCLIIVTELDLPDKKTAFIAYIPKSKNELQLWNDYNDIIISFSVKNDSKK